MGKKIDELEASVSALQYWRTCLLAICTISICLLSFEAYLVKFREMQRKKEKLHRRRLRYRRRRRRRYSSIDERREEHPRNDYSPRSSGEQDRSDAADERDDIEEGRAPRRSR